jgi:hypothetical protein
MEFLPETKKRKVQSPETFKQANSTIDNLRQQVAKLGLELDASTKQFDQRCYQGRTKSLSWTKLC